MVWAFSKVIHPEYNTDNATTIDLWQIHMCHQHFSELVSWVHFYGSHYKFQLSLDLRPFSISKNHQFTQVSGIPRGAGTFRLRSAASLDTHTSPCKSLSSLTSGTSHSRCLFDVRLESGMNMHQDIFQQIRVKCNSCHTVRWLFNTKVKRKFPPMLQLESLPFLK